MDLGISGKKAIVCASSRGLGLGCAKALANEGCELVINGLDEKRLTNTAITLATEYNATVIPIVADISTPEGQAKLLKVCPTPDILVNNNGGIPRLDFRELDREKMIDGVIQHMVASIELTMAVIDGMAERGFGRIINITSTSVKSPMEGFDLSSGARAGLTSFMAGVCRQFAAKNVTINHLLPGSFDTDRLQGGLERNAESTGRSIDAVVHEYISKIPANRFGTAEELGQVCAFLASVHASYITGQNIVVDGGLVASAF